MSISENNEKNIYNTIDNDDWECFDFAGDHLLYQNCDIPNTEIIVSEVDSMVANSNVSLPKIYNDVLAARAFKKSKKGKRAKKKMKKAKDLTDLETRILEEEFLFGPLEMLEKQLAVQALRSNVPPDCMLLTRNNPGFFFGKLRNFGVFGKSQEKDGNIAVIGATGSGKSSSIVIPSCMSWKGQILAIDIKRELYRETKHKRKNIKLFDPMDDNAYGYDPFYLLNQASNMVQEAQAIAHALIPLPPETKDSFWIDSARDLLTGAILHYHKDYSFVDTISKILSKPVDKLVDEINENKKYRADYFISSFVDMDIKTLAGIFSELCKNIRIFATDEDIIKCLTKPQERNIYPVDLEQEADVYIHIPQHLLRQWKNLLVLIIRQFLTHFEKRDEKDAKPILFMLDEFAALGKIDGIADSFSILRSKKITICAVVQSLAQLDAIYGEKIRSVIMDNCQYIAILGVNDADSQKYFSTIAGTNVVYKKSYSQTYDAVSKITGYNKTLSESREQIFQPHEFAALKDNVVVLSPYGLFMPEKVPYYTIRR